MEESEFPPFIVEEELMKFEIKFEVLQKELELVKTQIKLELLRKENEILMRNYHEMEVSAKKVEICKREVK